jgi:hypothetical protein
MNALNEPVQNLFDLELELVEEVSATDKNKCLFTAYQSTCGGDGCRAQG